MPPMAMTLFVCVWEEEEVSEYVMLLFYVYVCVWGEGMEGGKTI